jgi:putative acetyltransferase
MSAVDERSTTPSPPRPPELTIRARAASDWQEIAALVALPKVCFGTLRLPYTNPEETRRWLEKSSEGTSIVATLDGKIVSTAGITQYKGRRSHAGGIGLCVHDDFHGRGIGSAMLAALIDAADNWLNLRRLELTVYVDNDAAIALYKKFGFTIEGRRCQDAFRAGLFVDSYAMARLRTG